MNIATHFDYNNHIAFISIHTKIGTRYMQTVVNLLIWVQTTRGFKQQKQCLVQRQ